MEKRKRTPAKIIVIKSEDQQKAEKLIKQIKPYICKTTNNKTDYSETGR